MKSIFTLLSLFLILNLVPCSLQAQIDQKQLADEIEYQDVVYLLNGSILRGKIVDWKFGQELKMVILGGMEISIPNDDIDKVRQELIGDIGVRRGRRAFKFKEKGMYNLLSVNMPMGSELGIGVTYSIGHRFNRWISAGAGFGYQDFEVNWGAQVIPVFLEGRGYLSSKRIAPYYSMRAGLGFPIKNENYNVVSTNPGLLLNPEIGYRFGGNEVHFYLGVGYHMQKAEYTVEPQWWESRIDVDHLTYKRLDLKFGIDF